MWWVNEGLRVQLSVVMRPLPHYFSLGHNESTSPAPGSSASPTVGSGGNRGNLRPLHWRACHFGLDGESSCQMELWKEHNSVCLTPPLPTPPSHHPGKPGMLLGHGIAVLWCHSAGSGSRGPGAHNCIWFARLGGYINIMSALITSGSSEPPRYAENESRR